MKKYIFEDTLDREEQSYIFYDGKWREGTITLTKEEIKILKTKPKVKKFGNIAYKIDNFNEIRKQYSELEKGDIIALSGMIPTFVTDNKDYPLFSPITGNLISRKSIAGAYLESGEYKLIAKYNTYKILKGNMVVI